MMKVLTESTICMTTWKATKAARINTLHDGSSAFCRYTARNIVTTEIKMIDKVSSHAIGQLVRVFGSPEDLH